ncbi:MAG: amino acid ABC transporter permease [Rhodocyclaceae bacterium]|jgi:polar amino acid transport system permease protein|nr:amino acid ABC transporter permease [Rhodocyclaceae bacterium]
MGSWHNFLQDLSAQWPVIWSGLLDTLHLTVTISVSGFLLGIAVFYCSISRYVLIRKLTEAYISFFIGMPLIVLLFLMYYGLPQWGIKLEPFTVAVIGFTMNVAAYNAAYLTTAYNSLDQIELEAARAQGFSEPQVFRYITLPQVLRFSVPALTNQVIGNLKDSSVAFLIQYTEFFARIQELASYNFQFFKAYMFAAVVYLLLVSVIVIVARMIERRICVIG